MRLALSDEQTQFGAALHELLDGADVAAAARDWATGDHARGLALWRRLAATGVTALAIPERHGGAGADPADLVVACEELGHHAMPGPVAESVAAVPTLLAALGDQGSLPRLAEGDLIATLAAPPQLPYALDADAAGLVLLAADGALRMGVPGAALRSVDASRRLFEVGAGAPVAPDAAAAIARALDLGALAGAAQLLGAGRALLETAGDYARQRTQFGRPVGQFQAVKHQLADVAIGLEFARPLLYAAAVTLAPRDISAARVACADAADRAARTALQVHGAMGYTQEYGLDRWLTKVRALRSSWGTQAEHRARVMAALAG
ncbi:acyl-CoA dehydrogenase family protein [Phytohabitans rumicis]|uniref:Acyl-CoA dehydrogenase n=1 Tax=Phytohabitans rumicis TaxID=1076125 RepID=A0A6V8LJM5_9ACTN|nr:acyl-CoA dehydrogenase family protein [Phytohabitans rumicis]GFJ96414.1 acyl-CoA dehydrogenase [Phytohabitans rumicis]